MMEQRLNQIGMIALFLGWFIWFRPPLLGGGTSFIMVTGASMEPGMVTGDLAIVRQSPRYAVGDVIAFRVDDDNVIHRIIGGNASQGFVMQGDNKDAPDPWKPTPEHIIGKLWLFIPAGGKVIRTLQQPVYIALLGILMLLLTPGDPYGKLSRRRRRMMERRAKGGWS